MYLLPSLVSISRLVAGSIVAVSMLDHGSTSTWAIPLMLCLWVWVGVSDVLDGALARHLRVESRLGAFLDSCIDKSVMCGALWCMATAGAASEIVPPTVALAVMIREFVVTHVRVYFLAAGREFRTSWLGRAKISLQWATVMGFLLQAELPIPTGAVKLVSAAMVIATIASGVQYTARLVEVRGWE